MPKFEKGKSGNPGGMPKIYREIVDLARSKSKECIETLFELSQNAKNENVRVTAAEALLDRGFGKPKQSMELSGDPERPLNTVVVYLPQNGRDKPEK